MTRHRSSLAGKRAQAANELQKSLESANIKLQSVVTDISWIGLCPGQNESAGKRKSGRTRKGNRALRCALVEAAHGAVRKKDSYYGAQYRRIAVRRGKKRAIVAVAHSMAIAIYHMLKRKMAYRELGANFFDANNPLRTLNRLTKRIESFGYHVSVTMAGMAA